ncbi:molybdate ABC transporter substrate-binding protein [Chelatococcus sp. GCM10030263]|uniref:molybdate ABC transporter substrate-binding protein n=1 Tax=Chelatococcus sp. GCM10030263 TaxID=3273387 RepID=UPI00361284B8
MASLERLSVGKLAGAARALLFAICAVAVAGPSLAAEPKAVTVFAAASLKDALDAVGAQWQRDTGKRVVMSYAASSAIARQIEAGAPADLFISADLDWMDYLAKKGLIAEKSRVTLLGNRLVIVAAKDSTTSLAIAPGFDLAGALAGGRLAMGDVAAVPAGKYGKAALETLGVWPSVEGKIAQAENVRAALLLVSRGEAPLGIVYATDAAADANVRVVGTFPEDSHPRILYPAALVKGSDNQDAAQFLDYLKSPAARPLFERQGFTVLSAPTTH